MMPERIQRRRTKGWRMPQDAVYVGRPTIWGNLWRAGETPAYLVRPDGFKTPAPAEPLSAEQAVQAYRDYMTWLTGDEQYLAVLRRELGGKDLACWCGPARPCHADVLLKLANPEATS